MTNGKYANLYVHPNCNFSDYSRMPNCNWDNRPKSSSKLFKFDDLIKIWFATVM